MEEILIEQVHIKVKNIDAMTNFYEKIVGLILLRKDGHRRYLGIQGTTNVLLILEELHEPIHEVETVGLYHMAFLLPTRKDLANYFNWL